MIDVQMLSFPVLRKRYAKGLKEIFWLLFYQLKKVTRSAERNKAQEYKLFEWKVQTLPTGQAPLNPFNVGA
jgi:hypothetical protein